MSRLIRNIERLRAQRACLDFAAEVIRDLPGPVLELGLGNGRTYDHLRELLPGREIFVFDREVAAHPDCVPEESHLFLGDFTETVPKAVDRFGRTVALIHADVGSANLDADARKAAFLARRFPALVRSGGVIAADRDVGFAGAEAIEVPDATLAGRYFLYRVR